MAFVFVYSILVANDGHMENSNDILFDDHSPKNIIRSIYLWE